MLVKILVVVAFVAAVFSLVLAVHNVVVSNKVVGSMKNWAQEVDDNVNKYIRGLFSQLVVEYDIRKKDDNNNLNNSDENETIESL